MREAIRSLRQRLSGMAARGVLRLVNDAAGGQLVQIQLLAGETRDFVQRIQQYGFTSVPLTGALPVVVVCPHGDRAQALAIAVDDTRHRPTGGAAGDVVIYDSRGNRVRLLASGIEITAAGDLEISIAGDATVAVTGNAQLSAVDVTIEADGNVDLTAGGNVAVTADGDVEVNAGGDASVIAGGDALLEAAGMVDLGAAGGPAVARIGDQIVIPFVGVGTITTGSTKVRSA